MARRSVKRAVSRLLLSVIGILLVLVAMIIMIMREYPLQAAAVLLVGLTAVIGWKHVSAQRWERRNVVARQIAERQIDVHAQALLSYFRQSIRSDLFGNEDASAWQRHIDTFLATKVAPELSSASVRSDHPLLGHLAKYVDRSVRARNAESISSGRICDVDIALLSPREYEQHCASILFRCGWTVHPTPVTADHGADVVAEKNGQRLIVQCKLYGQPVGNKAVQEVYAARPLYHGTHACVVAPSGFTAQAQRAAHGLSVRLLHHSDLEHFAQEISGPARVSERPAPD